MDQAADIGYKYIEPMVLLGTRIAEHGRVLPYPVDARRPAHHEGRRRITRADHLLAVQSCSAGQAGRERRLSEQSIRYAAEVGSPMIMVDDGPLPTWTTEAENYTLMRYTLQEAAKVAEPRGIKIAIETHGEYTATPERLEKIMTLIDSPALTINLDTGNSYLSENDPHEWLEQIIGEVTHLHAKDIGIEDASRLRGKVRGMLGCACGDGVIDWERIVKTLHARRPRGRPVGRVRQPGSGSEELRVHARSDRRGAGPR